MRTREPFLQPERRREAALGFRVLGFWSLGFRAFGFKVFGVWGLGFRV